MPYPRSLTFEEHQLVKWMLEHGEPGAERYISQLEQATVISGCACGCASIHFQIGDNPSDYTPGLTVISDYIFQRGADGHFGAFVFTEEDMLSGLEVYSFSDASGPLPRIDELIPFHIGYKTKNTEQGCAPNSHAFGTFGTSAAEQPLVPKAGGSR